MNLAQGQEGGLAPAPRIAPKTHRFFSASRSN